MLHYFHYLFVAGYFDVEGNGTGKFGLNLHWSKANPHFNSKEKQIIKEFMRNVKIGGKPILYKNGVKINTRINKYLLFESIVINHYEMLTRKSLDRNKYANFQSDFL